MSAFLRILLLVCSLPLALPSGWCCAVAPHSARPAEAREALCPCCRHEEPGDSQPAPLHEPARACACGDRDTTLPDAPKNPVPTPDLVAVLVVPGLPTASPTFSAAPAVLHPPFLEPPLHVLHCIWLC